MYFWGNFCKGLSHTFACLGNVFSSRQISRTGKSCN